jgi:hypothetical protein
MKAPMRARFLTVLMAMGAAAATAAAQASPTPAPTPMDIQPVVELKPTGSLATCGYKPTATEAPYYARLSSGETTNDASMGNHYSIHGKKGKRVAWFGVVRGITPPAEPGGEVTLLVQHHYFDGMTDCHIMVVEWTGDGDFTAKLNVDPHAIPALSLVRVYGTVSGETAGVPELQVEYIRVWPWRTFTFMDLAGKDHSNPRWSRFAQGGSEKVYDPYPNDDYYLAILGDPAEFGLNLRPQ